MIYVIGSEQYSGGELIYKFLDVDTESFFEGNTERLKQLMLKHKMKVKNIKLVVPVQKGPTTWRDITFRAVDMYNAGEYILLCRVSINNFKVVVGYSKIIRYIDYSQLKSLIKDRRVCNCMIQDDKLETIGTYEVTQNSEFIQQIEAKYERYEAMSAMLGHKMSFKYFIEGEKVILQKYTGAAKNVIIPKFITTILSKAFYGTEIESVAMEDGLKSIGSQAFEACNLSSVVIPETVEFMGERVFTSNKRLKNKIGFSMGDKVKVLNANAVVTDRYNHNLY